jgi:predicted phage terminase large subunit-like protein
MVGKMTEREARLYWEKIKARTMAIKVVDDVETEAERKKRIRFLEADYVRWFEYYFPNYAKKKCAKFHKRLSNDIIKNKRVRELMEAFRSAGKSVHIDMGIPLYLYYALKDLHFMLLIGETETKAAKLLGDIQAQIEFNPRLIRDYGKRQQIGDWAEGDFTTSDGVKFMSLGFRQNPRGAREGDARPDYIVVDDVDNKNHVNNDRLMKEGVDYITEDVWGCFDADDDATERFVYANNNFHKNSITNRLKSYFLTEKQKLKQTGDEDIFNVLTVNAVKDLTSFEPSWPEKTTAEYWKKKFNSMPYRSFMREYMNTHIADGSVFKNDDIIFGPMLPLGDYEALVFYGDLSYKDKGDFKGLILVGKTGRQFHIIFTYLRRASRAMAAEWLYDLYEDKHLGRYNIKYMIEGLFAMDEFVNDFDNEGDRRGYYIPVVADERGKANKFDRIEGMSGYFERHNVIFNIAEKECPDQVTLRDQFLAFEKGSQANDDGPDAVHGAFKELFTITRVDRFPVQTQSRAEALSKSKNRF